MSGGGRFLSSNLKGFTLAEVLITLGIIGVVAAMTMPALIANHQRNVTVTRLERTYNTFANALVRAQVDYGDPSNWDYDGIGIELDGSEESKNSAYNSVESCVRKYIIPYLAGGYTFENKRDKTAQDLGYKSPILYRSGNMGLALTSKLPVIMLNDGTWVFLSYMDFGGNTDADGNVVPKRSYGLRLLVDINGPKPPNVFGKDAYIICMYFAKNSRLSFLQKVSFRPSENLVIFQDITREELLNNCETQGSYCGALIQSDGWQIKYKY